MRLRLLGCGLALLGALSATACAQEERAEELVLLAEPGPWPWVSRLIGFGERLWLANTWLAENSSTDLYSYDPRTGEVRYEGALFSQGAGRPVVAGGWLLWPHEDSRFHLGVGLLSTSDGEQLRVSAIPGYRIEHTHALAWWRGRLVASTSFVRPLLLASDDSGRSWEVLYRSPLAPRRVARLLRLEPLGERLFGYLLDGLQVEVSRTLVELRDGELAPVPGWPRHAEVLGLTAFEGRLHAVVEEEGGRQLWRTDGDSSERVGSGPPEGRLRDLAASPSELWALTVDPEGGGSVWRSADGRRWRPAARVSGGRPQELHLYAGTPYVAGQGSSGRGALWGPSPPAAVEAPVERTPWPPRPPPEPPLDWAAERATLRRVLADPESYGDRLAPLADSVLRLALAGPPPGFFESLLEGPFPPGSVPLLENAHEEPIAQLGPWVLLFGVGLSGGAVPSELLRDPWRAGEPARKSFEPLLAALAALSWTGRSDAAASEVLTDRLRDGRDPTWLTGDVVAALSAITGRRFGHDRDAWLACCEASNAAEP